MNDTIQIKGGNGAVPTKLQDRELAYRRDTNELFIGNGEQNIRLCGKSDAEAIGVLQTEVQTLKTQISTLNGQISTISSRLDALESKE